MDYDRSKLARIAAYGLRQGQSEAEIADRLLDYASATSPADIARAITEGKEAVFIAGAINEDSGDVAEGTMDVLRGEGAQRWQVVAAYNRGTADQPQWRHVAVELPAGASMEDIEAQVDAAIDALESEYGDGMSASGVAAVDLVYVAPLFE